MAKLSTWRVPMHSAARWRLGFVSSFAFACIIAAEQPAKEVDRSGKPQAGMASFYGAQEAGKTTASGDRMEPDKLTAASRTLPLGTQAQVVNKDNGKAVTVTINDRGPYAQNRVVDVTPKAAHALGMTRQGVASVEVKPVREPPPPR